MYSVGIDLGGTKIAVGLVNQYGEIIAKESISTKKERGYQDIIRDMSILIDKTLEKSGKSKSCITHIGIGVPGTPDCYNGVVVYCANINFKNTPIRAEIQKHINLPVFIDNDANCAALAESIMGSAKNTNNSVLITLGTGVGSGIIINGKIYRSFNYAAGELGHNIIMFNGELCGCGKKGCWEAYASGTALIRQTKEASTKNPHSKINTFIKGDLSKINAKTVFDVAKQGDEIALQVVKQYIEYIGIGIINIVNTLQPEIIVIGGGISREGENLLNPLREFVLENSYGKGIVTQTNIEIAKMGNDAGILGASMLKI